MRVCIAGSRDHTPRMLEDVAAYVDALADGTEVIHGGARGVDAWAHHAAQRRGLVVREFRPDYGLGMGRVTPLWRNAQMAREADHVVVFWRRGSRGSENMIGNAFAAGVPCEVYVYED